MFVKDRPPSAPGSVIAMLFILLASKVMKTARGICVSRKLLAKRYTRSPLEDSRLFGPSPWKMLATTYKKDTSEQPSPWRKSSKRESCYGGRV